MKKIRSLLSLMLALILALTCLSACNGDGADTDGSESDTDLGEYITLATNGISDYRVVVSADATDAVKRMTNELLTKIKEIAGVKPDRATDNTSKYPPVAHEIFIGVSGRDETKTALDELDTTGYKIEYTGGKLIVVATNDFMLSKAMDALVNTYLAFDNGSVMVRERLSVSYDGSADMSLLLNDDGSFKYQIIYPDDNAGGERALASSIRDELSRILGCKVAIARSDKAVEANDDSFEILVGKTNRQQSTELYRTIGVSELVSTLSGNKLLIGAGVSVKLNSAVSAFINDISEATKGTYDGKKLISVDYSLSQHTYEWLEALPMMDVGTFVGSNDMGDDSLMFVWDDTAIGDYESYTNTMKELGWTEKSDYTLGENDYVLLESSNAYAYVSYVSASESTRVFVEGKTRGTEYPSKTQASYTAVSGYEPTLWQVAMDSKNAFINDSSYTHEHKGANGGMCYVMQVADGSFVVIDGGYDTETQATTIYELLRDNSPTEIPVISAWIFTHDHGDHTPAFERFTKLYRNKVSVKAFYYNFPAVGFDLNAGGGADGGILLLMKQYSGAKIYRKLHSGMTFYVADARFDVIYTHEDLYPYTSDTLNDASTVLRVTFGGQRIMFLGDVQTAAGAVIEETVLVSELKSDIVQYSHHGWNGPEKTLYDKIEAPTVLWPVNVYSWQYDCYGENIFDRLINRKNDTNYYYSVNYYIAHEAEYVDTVIIHGEGTTKLVLPYNP